MRYVWGESNGRHLAVMLHAVERFWTEAGLGGRWIVMFYAGSLYYRHRSELDFPTQAEALRYIERLIEGRDGHESRAADTDSNDRAKK